MKIKSKIIAIPPKFISNGIRKAHKFFKLYMLEISSANRFLRFFSNLDSYGIEQLAARLMFFTHQIEKGLSHISFRPGFGFEALHNLVYTLDQWDHQQYPQSRFEYRCAVSVLSAYAQKHQLAQEEMPLWAQQLIDARNDLLASSDKNLSGYAVQSTSSKVSVSPSYSDTLEHRVSIREFAAESPDLSTVTQSISVAMRAPTVCNRQPQRIYLLTNPSIINQALRIQGGWNGYSSPPILALVTSKLSSFVNVIERNEPYVDGGIFGMAFLGALEEKNLGACPLNTMFEQSREKKIRQLLSLPEDEVLIMFVAIGNKLPKYPHPVSRRKDSSDIISYIK